MNYPRLDIAIPSAINYLQLPMAVKGSTTVERDALAAATNEIKVGAGKVDGNNHEQFGSEQIWVRVIQ